MSSPVQISDLSSAPGGAQDADLALIRRSNTTDYKVLVSSLRSINTPGLPALPAPLQATDLMIVNQGAANCKVDFGRVGFVAGVRMWFYTNSSNINGALYWGLVPNTGDTLLAVKGGSTYNVGGTSNLGTWQQVGATLGITQIPNHQHYYRFGQDQSNSGATYVHGAKRLPSGGDPKFGLGSGIVGGQGDNPNHDAYGGCDPHNHGNTWRPLASVGSIFEKLI